VTRCGVSRPFLYELSRHGQRNGNSALGELEHDSGRGGDRPAPPDPRVGPPDGRRGPPRSTPLPAALTQR
jgi:hypothetical protein